MMKYILFVLAFWAVLIATISFANRVETLARQCYMQHNLAACDKLEEIR